MATSLLKKTRFRIIFLACLFSLAQVQWIMLTKFGINFKYALYDSSITHLLLAGAALLISTTLQYYIPEKNRYSYVSVLVLMLSVIWLLLGRTLIMFITGDQNYMRFFDQSLAIRALFGLLILGFMSLISVLYYTIQDQQELERRKTEAEALYREAELYKLRVQLQPHFLFNSLNSINALISFQPQQARNMIQQLSDFLRGTLKREEDEWVSLTEELQQLQLYLEIEKVRFGHRLSTEIENETATDMKMPAMLLQPLVENAIKFGLYDTTGEITIRIRAWQQNQLLHITVSNPFDESASSIRKGTGFGLSSVQRRLYLVFGRHDLLQTTTEGDTFNTLIKIPQLK